MGTKVASALITITDQNDYIFSGTTAPTNPIANVTLWNDTSTTPIIQKLWNGSAWVVVNEVVIGGKNLLLDSDFNTLNSGVYTIVSPYDAGPYIYTLSIDSANKYEGYNSLKVVGTSAGNINSNGYRFFFKIQNNFALSTNYVLSFYIKASAACNVSARSFWGTLIPSGTQAVGTSFQKVTLNIMTGTQADNFFTLCFDAAVTAYICKPKLEVGTKATDWTPAVEDVQTDIYAAQVAADAANTAIANITSDNILSGSEKPGERLRWNDISNEKAGINSQASSYGITTENTAYNTAFQNLANYLNAGTTWASGVPSWLSDANIATDTAIVGATYRQKWNDYYSTKQALLNAIYTKAKALADAAQSNVDLLEASIGQSVFSDTFNETQAQYNLRWTNYTGSGNPTIVADADATGGSLLKIGDNSGDDKAWIIGNTSIPYDPNRLYMIKARFRKTAGTGSLFVGIAGRDATDTMWVNTSGDNYYTGQHYVCVNGYVADGNWLEVIGYFKGHGTLLGGALNPLSPSGLHANVRYFRPIVIANYNGVAGITDFDYVIIDYADGAAAKATADNAATAASNAQTAANTANAAIANIVSDSVLDSSEKPSQRQAWDVIAGEKSGINSQASSFGITTENASYNTAFQNLANYLNAGTTWSSGIPSWIADANLGNNTTIVGSTYRSTWAAFYTARTTLLNAIAAKAKALADAAQNTATSAMFLKGSMVPMLDYWYLNSQSITTISDGKEGNTALRIGITGSAFPNANMFIPVDTSRGYKVRFWARASADCNGVLYFSLRQFQDKGSTPCAANNGRSPYSPSAQPAHTDWRLYEHVWSGSDFQSGVKYVLPEFLNNYNGTAGYWDIQGFAMYDFTEMSATQADATLAKAKVAGRTIINGGVAETDIVLLGTGGIAGMSGIPVDSNNNPLPARWVGGTYAQACAGNAAIIEYFTGDAKFGDFYIEAAGAISIKDSGNIKRVIMTRSDISTLASLAGSTQNTNISNSLHGEGAVGTTIFDFTNLIVVNNNNSQITLNTTLSVAITALTTGAAQGFASLTVQLKDANSGATYFIDSASIGSSGYGGSTTKGIISIITVPAGTYYLEAKFEHYNYNECAFWSQVNASTVNVFYDSSVQRTEIGKNGMGIIANATNYVFMGVEGGIFKMVEKVTGGYDKPGVLLCGDVVVGTTPYFGNIWGAKSSSASATKYATGVYRINHNLGFVPRGATANAKAKSGSNFVMAMITAKTTTYVEVSLGYGSTAVDVNFEFQITGNNQA